MFFYVYVLQSVKNNKFYIGSTKDLIHRVKEHNLGQSFATKPFRPWKLIYYEANLNQEDAKRREMYLKTTQGGRLLKRRLKEYLFSLRFA